MQQVYKTLPDDKPITAICIIEDSSKCPPGFCIVSKSHDQDSDADLWKEYSFFGRRICRYLCISKTEGIANYIVENVKVIGEKDMPPDGFCLIPRTVDGDSKAWRKRQLCYSLTRRNLAAKAITDIILLSKSKRAPEGFTSAGDVNGLLLCYKTSTVFNLPTNNGSPSLAYGLGPPTTAVASRGTPSPGSAAGKGPVSNGGVYPLLGKAPVSSPSSDEYVNLIRPTRPAPPLPPKPSQNSPGSYATMSGYQGLEGIPFVLNPNLRFANSKNMDEIPVIKAKTKEELDKEYFYDFRLEKQT